MTAALISECECCHAPITADAESWAAWDAEHQGKGRDAKPEGAAQEQNRYGLTKPTGNVTNFDDAYEDWTGYAECEEIRYAAEELLSQDHIGFANGKYALPAVKDILSNRPLPEDIPPRHMENALNYAKLRQEEAFTMIDSVRTAEPTTIPLWRGATIARDAPGSEVMGTLKVGDHFDTALVATTPDQSMAQSFAGGMKGDTPVLMKILPGAKAQSSDVGKYGTEVQINGKWQQVATEYITGGRFYVSARREVQGRLLLTLKQVGVFNPRTGELEKR